MGKKRARSPLKSMDEVNLTPMMDLVFLLLIVFMITTPLLENAINVTPPVQKAGAITEEKPIMVNITDDGLITYENKTLSREELASAMRQLKINKPTAIVSLRAGGAREYKEVIDVLGIIAKEGFQNVNLITLEQ